MWIWLTLTAGVFNALWTSRVKSRVQTEGALVFTASMRWGVALCLLPVAIYTWEPVPSGWWILSALAGALECLSLWAVARGMRRDYYSTYALSNTSPFFVGFTAPFLLGEVMTPTLGAGILLVVAGALWLYYRGHWSWWGILGAVIGTFSGLASKQVIGLGSATAHSCAAFGLGALLMSTWLLKEPRKGIGTLARNLLRNKDLILLSAIATFCFYAALQLAPLSKVSPLIRVNLVVGFLLSYFHLGETDHWRARGFGGLLILAGIVLVLV